MLTRNEIMQTLDMIDQQHLDIRTITMGISCFPAATRTRRRPAGEFTIKSAATLSVWWPPGNRSSWNSASPSSTSASR